MQAIKNLKLYYNNKSPDFGISTDILYKITFKQQERYIKLYSCNYFSYSLFFGYVYYNDESTSFYIDSNFEFNINSTNKENITECIKVSILSMASFWHSLL